MPETRTEEPTPQGGWHTPEDDSAVAPETPALPGWKVPTLPTEISEFPDAPGGWHRPRTNDTTLTPNDETVIIMPAEEAQAALPEAQPVAPEDVPAPLSPEEALRTLTAETEAVADEPATEALSPEDALSMVELAGDDDEEEAGVRTELLALNMLAEDAVAAVDAPAGDDDSALPAGEGQAVSADDPAEVARRKLAELEAASAGVADAVETLADSQDDAAAEPPALTGAEMRAQELARRFSQTQEDIEQIRRLYQQGQITPEQFEAELQNRMILDDDQIWWRMGADDAAWYKYVGDQWTPAVPPLLTGARAGLQTERLNPNDPFGSTLPYIGDSAPVEESGVGTMPMSFGYTPLPNAVPTEDLDNTMVSPAAFRDSLDNPTIAGNTVPIGQRTGSGSLGYGASPSIESPVDESMPPEIDYTMPVGPIAVEAEARQRSAAARTGVLVLVGVVALALIAIAAGLFLANGWYAGIVERYEPRIAALAAYQPEFQTVVIQDVNRRTIARLADGGDREEVELSEISQYLIHAVISTRNPTFFGDPGWDTGTTISTWVNDMTGGSSAVPSPTITQLVASSLVLSQDPNAADIDLVVVSGEMSQRYTKDFILSLFLNEFPFGNGTFGAEAASRFYFQKSAADLNLPEAALLAAIMQNPGGIDPVTNRGIVKPAVEAVFARMAEVGCVDIPQRNELCISSGDFNTAQIIRQKADVELRPYEPRDVTTDYPHFVNLVRQQLETVYGSELYQRGFTVRTTFSPEAQIIIQDMLRQRIQELSGVGVTTGAAMWTDPVTGAIRAYVGSPDYDDPNIQGQRDYARDFLQPGGVIMPIVYATGLEGVDRNGSGQSDFGEYITAGSVVWDVPAQFPAMPSSAPFAPANLSGRFYGPVSVREALANQYASAATSVYDAFGEAAFRTMAESMGIQFADGTVFSLATAVGETPVRLKDLMTVYGTIANGGIVRPVYAIEQITDRAGNPVEMPDIIKPVNPQRAITPQTAYILQNILSDDGARNTSLYPRGSALTLPNMPALNGVGATPGTNAARTSLWTLGFTSNAVVGVWLGTPDSTVSFGSQTTGFTAAAPLWQRIIGTVIASLGSAPRPFSNPGGVVEQDVCALTGTAYTPQSCPGNIARREIFAQSRLPSPAELGIVRTFAINTWTGLRASQFCSSPEDTVQRTYVDASNPFVINWLQTAEGRQVAQRLGLGTSVEAAPVAECDATTQLPVANIVSPVNGQPLQGEVQIIGQVSVPANFNRWQLEIAPQGSSQFTVLPGFPQNTQQPNANTVLATWDTRTVPNGVYSIRLAVISNDGGFVYRGVNVSVNNPLPTPTPQPTMTPTIFPTFPPFDVATSIPFDPIPTFGPSPTLDPF